METGLSFPISPPYYYRMAEQANAYVILNQDNWERSRLTTQFWFLHKHLSERRLIHDKGVSISPDEIVLESGAGTGIWSIELSKLVPSSVTIDAIDISTKLFPQDDVPLNVHFSQNSILSLPSEWASRFDFASQKLLVTALTRGQWRIALSELRRVIKPGGHIQLVEVMWSRWVLSTGPTNESIRAITQALYEKQDFIPDVSVEVPLLLEELGFVDITVERRPTPVGGTLGEEGSNGARTILDTLRAMKLATMKLGIVHSEEFENLLAALQDEWAQGLGGYFTNLCVICARKAGP